MRLAAASAIVVFGSCVSFAALADEELKKEDMDKILEALASLGCTEIKGEGEDEGTHFEIDDIICNGYSYDIQIDKEMNVITMVRDPKKRLVTE